MIRAFEDTVPVEEVDVEEDEVAIIKEEPVVSLLDKLRCPKNLTGS